MEFMTNYKNIQPTYSELTTALKAIGLKEKKQKKRFVFVDKEGEVMVLLPKKKDLAKVEKTHFVAVSYNLRDLGLVTHEHDLGKMIEQMRLQQKATA